MSNITITRLKTLLAYFNLTPPKFSKFIKSQVGFLLFISMLIPNLSSGTSINQFNQSANTNYNWQFNSLGIVNTVFEEDDTVRLVPENNSHISEEDNTASSLLDAFFVPGPITIELTSQETLWIDAN